MFSLDPIIIFIGFFVGVLIGLTGMGGGALMTPLLIFVGKIPPIIAVGTDLAFAAITKSFGAIQHFRQKNVKMEVVLPIMLVSIPASLLGVYMIDLLKRHYFNADIMVKSILGLVLISVSIILFLLPLFKKKKENERLIYISLPYFLKATVLGGIVGFLVGFTSVGSGTLVFVGLIIFSKLSIKEIVANDIFHAAFLTFAAAIGHWWGANIDMNILIPLLLGSIPGVLLGAKFSARLSEKITRPILASVLLIAGVKLI